jgi:site-specific recombinase XerD
VEWLSERGYAENGIYVTIEYGLRFAEHATAQGVLEVGNLSRALADGYLETLADRPRAQASSRCAVRHVLGFLQERGVIRVDPAKGVTAVESPILREYRSYLLCHRGIGESHTERHAVQVEALLSELGQRAAVTEISSLCPTDISGFISRRVGNLPPSERKMMCVALRVFLRYLYLRGHVLRDLSDCVPVIPQFKLDRLPQLAEAEDIERILGVIDRTSVVGRRDYAMLLMLATYGLRSGQLCRLRLDDIDWRHETIRIPASKGGQNVVLPLRPSVGEAVVDYLRHARPDWPFREIFLRVRPPRGTLRSHSVSLQIRFHACKAGVEPPPSARAWRHACATHMLAKGHGLKTIRDVLGHRTIETTFIYTKVDLDRLRRAALEWPDQRV